MNAGRLETQNQVLLTDCLALQANLDELSAAHETLVQRKVDLDSKILSSQSSLTQLQASAEVIITIAVKAV